MTDLQAPRNFIEEIVDSDLLTDRCQKDIHTRFPPEPNGFLHIGHAKAIYLNFSIKDKYRGKCNLRFDDTNPLKEEDTFVQSIQKDIAWLGCEWDELLFASDYFELIYECALDLIRAGKAYVCELSAEEIRATRGTLTQPGVNSPHRDRPIEENERLFKAMRAGEFEDGSYVLRAKIDMASPNMNMRDPVLYRILHTDHHRTGDTWCIYPMYDFAHPLSDAVEDITHSICTLEFEDHRPLYDWFLQQLPHRFPKPPRQIEFARLNLTRTIMSKRYLKKLVDEGIVSGWDDPRMPTISGLRRRGYTPEAIKDFCERIGVAKSNSEVDAALLEHCIREDLNNRAPRVMAVVNPVKLVIENYPEGQSEAIECPMHPEKDLGSFTINFSRELFIEREDFMEVPAPKFFRLAPGKEVRLKNAYIIKCERVEKDTDGNVQTIYCTYDPQSKSGESTRKVKGTLHFVSAIDAVDATVRQYDYLLDDRVDSGLNFDERINDKSLAVHENAKVLPIALELPAGTQMQFLRMGYFVQDGVDSRPEAPVFNRIIGLRDTWAKMNK